MGRLRHLADAPWLASRLDDPDLRIFDCTTALLPAEPGAGVPYTVVSGREEYDAGHIPGAGFLDLQEELSDPDAPHLFTVPSAEQFVAAMSRHGVGDGKNVVLYSTTTPAWATRVWWLLRLFGFDNVAVLDGGFQQWLAAGNAVSQTAATYPPATFVARPRQNVLARKDDVLEVLEHETATLVNTLSEELFRGDTPSKYGRPGRIPGSVSLPFDSFLDESRTAFLPAEACQDVLQRRVGSDTRIVSYCGGGITATVVDFVIAALGLFDDARLYDGSLSEWAPDASLPLERG
jgi:thiosulfate/3-mercaptopyruvate sulfurtransferase